MRRHEGMFVRLPKLSRQLMYREIVCVEVVNHYVHFHLTTGERVEVYATFGEIAQKLLGVPCFVQCHRSYIANMDEIATITGRSVTMRGGKVLPLSA